MDRPTNLQPVGFTGTQIGMSPHQAAHLRYFLWAFASEFHHGDCIGADEQAHLIALETGVKKIVIHPPSNKRKRAFCHTKYEAFAREKGIEVVVLPEKEYLARNKDIVNSTEGLVAAPRWDFEELRSGTWSTVRYARTVGKYHTILPRGSSL